MTLNLTEGEVRYIDALVADRVNHDSGSEGVAFALKLSDKIRSLLNGEPLPRPEPQPGGNDGE